ncbi:RHS repeat-associated core domain-containing protein [Hymenobacter algoricola]|uniref:RHS repeat-associated core domain-containing protein n=1 Tax=Hymenobacter algoricola TaxID=486267 RepID=UPI0031EA7144
MLRNPAGSRWNWKFEYHIKDHLGNLRFAFRDQSDNGQQRMMAGMEPANSEKEEQTFQHIDETRQQDAIHARSGNYVARLSKKEGRREGPSITWTVQAGDSVYAEAYGRYDRQKPLGVLQGGAIAVGANAANGVGPSLISEKKQRTTRRGIPFLGISLAITPQLFKLGHQVRSKSIPQTYLRYELYTQDSQLVATRVQQLRATADDEWQHLAVGMTADSAGYVKVSLINESDTPAYFDDLELRTVDPYLVQENHYDPFGLNLVGIESSSGQDTKFQFNGQEMQEDFGLNWNHQGARFYDPQLGRWHMVDALADDVTQVEFSPYQFSWNNPINYSDPEGLYAYDEFNQRDPEEGYINMIVAEDLI